MSKIILVTGGAGYIGSHTSYLLYNNGYQVIILDDLVYNQPCTCPWAVFIKGDFADYNILDDIFLKYNIDAVMHFAAFIEVQQSVMQPQRFYENNVIKTIQLIDKILHEGVKKFVFSSSCAVYGSPQDIPIDENHPFAPLSPYGKNKLVVECVLQDYAHAYGLQYVSLRYFNAAGALIDQDLGEWHNPETHVIPNLMRAILLDKAFCVFGDDYATIDGSCIRDYIHVLDIAAAHVLAYEYLQAHAVSQVFNLGSGMGYTVKQLVRVAEEVAGKKIRLEIANRRPGDVPTLVANTTKIKNMLGWQPQYSDLASMITTAYAWEKKRLAL
jgi:UDP-glucose 4-epimerase